MSDPQRSKTRSDPDPHDLNSEIQTSDLDLFGPRSEMNKVRPDLHRSRSRSDPDKFRQGYLSTSRSQRIQTQRSPDQTQKYRFRSIDQIQIEMHRFKSSSETDLTG